MLISAAGRVAEGRAGGPAKVTGLLALGALLLLTLNLSATPLAVTLASLSPLPDDFLPSGLVGGMAGLFAGAVGAVAVAGGVAAGLTSRAVWLTEDSDEFLKFAVHEGGRA